MENKTAKIVKVSFISEWTGPNGKVFYHEIELDNGDRGQIGTKEKNPAKLNPGTELTYTIESTSHGNKIKAVVQNTFKGGGRSVEDPRHKLIAMAMSYTKDLVIGGKVPIEKIEPEFNRIYNIMISKL